MSDDVFIKYVAERRARSGRKFETCERMKPVFAELDAEGWNDWPPAPRPATAKDGTRLKGDGPTTMKPGTGRRGA
jgi:hypothetical protein